MTGRILVLTPDTDGTVGGVKIHYQVVDALNAAGREAAIVHGRDGFRCSWFANQTSVLAAGDVRLRGDDIVVVPEEWVHLIAELPPSITKVVFNQNAYTTFLWEQPWHVVKEAYERDDVNRVVTVSSDNLEYLQYAFPSVSTGKIRYMIDPTVFYGGVAKTRSVAYMPRRRADEASEVMALASVRGALKGWEVVPIVGRSEADTASLLRSASVFLSFSLREGFGLPPAEALACGCVVVGFHGFGGRDIGDDPLWVPEGDVVAFARTLEEVLTTWDGDADRWKQRAADGAAHVRTEFAPEQFCATVLEAFGDVEPLGGSQPVGDLSPSFWSHESRWPWVVAHLRSAARVSLKGGR